MSSFSAGVYVTHNSNVLANDSVVMISEIGRADNNRLQCVTDRMPCCTNPVGEWFFPGDVGIVPRMDMADTFFRNRGDDGTVNLNRLNSNAMMPTGQYCCVVPDATGVMQWACVVICKFDMV